MQHLRPAVGRRRAMGLLLGLPFLGAGRAARAQASAPSAAPFPEGASLLAAGPDGGEMENWARLLTPVLQRAMPADAQLRRTHAGGLDGVTGANQFHTSAQPDGASLLLAPGTAAMAWLAGDPRAHFDAGRWVGLLAGTRPVVLVSRLDPAALRRGQPVRVAVTAPYAPDLAGALGLELMGLSPVPVPGPPASATPAGVVDPGLAAFAQHAADMLVLCGRGLTERLSVAMEAGGRPLCLLSGGDGSGGPARDTSLPGMPGMMEFAAGLGLGMPGNRLSAAWQAVSATARLSFALVLPALTPVAMVALWRRAADQAAAAADVRAGLASQGLQLTPGPEAVTMFGAAPAADAASLAALREWMATRLRWRAG